MSEFQPTIFLVKNRALGDSIMGLSTVSYFRKLYPKSTIIYAVPQWTAELYLEVKTDADIIYPLNLSSISSILNLYTDLINFKVDAIHEMHQSGTGRKVFSFIASLMAIPYTAHNHHLESNTLVIDQGVKKELIQRDLDGLYSFYGKGYKCPSFLDYEPSFIATKTHKEKRVILGVVATRETKMWSLENYVLLARKVINNYPDLEVVIPLSHSQMDRELKSKLETLIDNSKIKIVHIKLSKLPKYFFESLAYIGNDTGLKHLAVATKIPSITLFGPEPIKEWHPYNQVNHSVFYVEDLPCRTRTHHYCGLYRCDLESNKFMQCMNLISVDMVFEKLKGIL